MSGSILVLVPHDPERDPRVLWSIDLCASLLPTRVLALSSGAAAAERRGAATIERIPLAGPVASTPGEVPNGGREWRSKLPIPKWVRGRRDALDHFTTTLGYYATFGEALRRQALRLSTPPTVIVCHDIYALPTAVRLKGLWGAKLLYDSHEYWPQADLLAERWEEFVTRVYERRLIRDVDTVVTVSPPLASLLETTYHPRRVVSVPNACPSQPDVAPSSTRPISSPRRFLLQGQASQRRGFEGLLDAWRRLGEQDAVLEIRCPPNPYLENLRRQYADLERSGRLRFLPAVPENELVAAAANSDVGLIPYPADSLNHVYACPNKLAQYMHAGLAVLSNDLTYVRSVIEKYRCGLVFNIERPDSVIEVVSNVVNNRTMLQAMKEASVEAAKTFNWEVQSRPYRDALTDLAGPLALQETV